MLSALGTSFGTALHDAFTGVGSTAGLFVLEVVTIVLALCIVGFVIHYIRSRVGQ
jgi:hypothetical protein